MMKILTWFVVIKLFLSFHFQPAASSATSAAPTPLPTTCSPNNITDKFDEFDGSIWSKHGTMDFVNGSFYVYSLSYLKSLRAYSSFLSVSGSISRSIIVENLNHHFVQLTKDGSFKSGGVWGIYPDTVAFGWYYGDKEILGTQSRKSLSTECVSGSNLAARKYTFEFFITDNSVEFYDDVCGSISMAETFFASDPDVYVYVGADPASELAVPQWNWISLNFDNCGDEAASANLTATYNKTCSLVLDDFDSFDSSVWDSQCAQCSYQEGVLVIQGDSMLQRSASPVYNLSYISAGFIKDKSCDDHIIVISSSSALTWSWESVIGSIKFAWNCDYKVIYGQISYVSTFNSSCNYDVGDYVVDIEIGYSSVSFTDSICGTLSLDDSLASSTDFLFIYIGADSDKAYDDTFYSDEIYYYYDDAAQEGARRKLSRSNGAAEWSWIMFQSGCYDSSLVEYDTSLSGGLCASDDLDELAAPSSISCWYACVGTYGYDFVVAANYWENKGNCSCSLSCSCLDDSVVSEHVVLVMPNSTTLPHVCGAPSPVPTSVPTCSVSVSDDFNNYTNASLLSNSSIWNFSFCSVPSQCYSDGKSLVLVAMDTSSRMMRSKKAYSHVKSVSVSASFDMSDDCVEFFVMLSTAVLTTQNWRIISTGVIFGWFCGDKQIYGTETGKYLGGLSTPTFRAYTMEFIISDNSVEFYDDYFGTLSMTETFFAADREVYVYIGTGSERGSGIELDWVSIDVDSGCDGSPTFAPTLASFPDGVVESCVNVFDDFGHFDSAIWDTQCSNCFYQNDTLRITGGSMLQRSAFAVRNLTTISAGFIKDISCNDHLIVISSSSALTWSWESVIGSIKFAWNCDYKVIYGQISYVSTFNSSCNYDVGDYVVDIEIAYSSVSFTDSICGTLSLDDSLASTDETLYVYIGSDNDIDYVHEGDVSYYFDDNTNGGSAEWLWFAFSSTCAETSIEIIDSAYCSDSGSSNMSNIGNSMSGSTCFYSCVDTFGSAVFGATYWDDSGNCTCHDSCDCISYLTESEGGGGVFVAESDHSIPETCAPTSMPTAAPTAIPQPGVNISSDAMLFVFEEEDVGVASFTIRLTEEPLSSVIVSFESVNGYLEIDPPLLLFTYSNYDVDATVSVYGVDDDIDQGDLYHDKVQPIVTSSDDLFNCLLSAGIENTLRNCNQAALYSGLTVSPINATITDNDKAGMNVSSVMINATYDNFGDALDVASYSITLLSEPINTVYVNLSGFGNYCTAFPSSVVVIEPYEWKQGKSVNVSCTATTDSRPVCSSGNRFCPTLLSRTELIGHSVSSLDPNYDGVELPSVRVNVDVVYDSSDPPKISVARFNNLLNAITVTFDIDTDRAGKSGSFDCNTLLNLTSTEVSTLFGSGATCSFISDSVLKVTFGSSATVLPGDEITLIDLVLKASLSGASLYTTNQTFVVEQPLYPTVPSLSLRVSSTSVGVCDDLVLDGSGATGSGGRAMMYNFSVMASSNHSLSNVSNILSETKTENGGYGTYGTTIPSENMPLGSKMTFTLTVTNFLGYSAVSTASVEKLSVPVPSLSIQGPSYRTVYQSDGVKLAASVSLPTMSCLDYDIPSAKMSFAWYDISSGSPVMSEISQTNPRVLYVPPNLFESDNVYTLMVFAYMIDAPYINNSATVDVEVLPSKIVALIDGGSYREVGVNSAFELIGSNSYDPDASSFVDDDSTALQYYWTCYSISNQSFYEDFIGFIDPFSSDIALSDSFFSLGKYRFSLLVREGGESQYYRNDTTSVIVNIVAEDVPVITISSSKLDSKFNVDDQYLGLSASVSSDLSYTSTWSAVSSDVSDVFTTQGLVTNKIFDNLKAAVILSALTQGNTYTFRLTVTNSEGVSSYSTVSLTVNESPSSGSLVVSPQYGFALNTLFTFNAINWVDEDLPFTYIYGTTEVNLVDGSLDTTTLSPFGDEINDASYSNIILSAGSNITNFTVGCYVEVVDYYGAVSYDTVSIYVGNSPYSTEQLQNISDYQVSDAIDSADTDASKQLILATAEGIQSAKIVSQGEDNLRRRLLGTASSAEVLRASLLSNLWATFDITPVTASEMASLLNTLASVADTPSEMTYDVASGTLNLLNTITKLSYNNKIGMTDTAAVHVGSILTSLYSSKLINASDFKGFLLNAQNMSGSIQQSSAAQLYGSSEGVGYSLSSKGVHMYSYRDNLGSILGGLSLSLSLGGISDSITSVTFNSTVSEFSLSTGQDYNESSVFDVRLYTLPSRASFPWVKGSSGTAAATASRLDQTNEQKVGVTLIRSDLTLVEISEQDSDNNKLTSSGLSANAVRLTLAANVPFNTSFGVFDRSFSCPIDGAVIDLNCPLTSDSHTCNQTLYGGGGVYHFDYTCPYVVPTCLYFDEDTSEFTDTTCEVVPTYSSDAVTCQCSSLGTFMLSATTTNSSFQAYFTEAPTPMPYIFPAPTYTLSPSPRPTHLPTSQPTSSPTLVPTSVPTLCVDSSPYCSLVKDFCETSFCPTCPQAGKCDVTCNIAACSLPTSLPTSSPTASPSLPPTSLPTLYPTLVPSPAPTQYPTSLPIPAPTMVPTSNPTQQPSHLPTIVPSLGPTQLPTPRPTSLPTLSPSHLPTYTPTVLDTPVCTGGTDPALYLLTMSDSAGDGWMGARIVINSTDQVTVLSTTLLQNSYRQQWICLSTDCYTITIAETDVEISWELEDSNQRAVTGSAPATEFVCTRNSTFRSSPTLSPTITSSPSQIPVPQPTAVPNPNPTVVPIPAPTPLPSLLPTSYPTSTPSAVPISSPSSLPIPSPSALPTIAPTELCVDGQYIDGNTCQDCPVGQYSSFDDDNVRFPTECTICQTGYYASETGLSSCLKCESGKTSNADFTDCDECGPGTFVNTTLGTCEACASGQYAPQALDTSCLECPSGSATGTQSGAIVCNGCDPGYYSNNMTNNTCLSCSPGQYSSTRASSCENCAQGTYAWNYRSSDCQNCDAGSSTLGLSASANCTKCPSGKFSSTRAADCTDCTSGRYQSNEGKSSCLACATGRFTNESASTNCTKCSAGTYQGATGQSACIDCDAGKYADVSEANYCFTCQDGYTSLDGAPSCDRCEENYFWTYDDTNDWYGCVKCPPSATCFGGLFQPIAHPGYWIDRKAAVDDPFLVKYVYKCSRDTCDISTDISTRRLTSSIDAILDTGNRRLSNVDSSCFLLANFSSKACSDSVVCTSGSTGPLCGACKVGWTYNSSQRKCTLCNQSTTWTQAFGILVGCFIGLGLLWQMKSGYFYIPSSLRFLTRGKTQVKVPIIGVFLSMDSGALKVLFSTLQIIMSVSWNLNVSFPQPYQKFTELMSFIQLDFFSLECLQGNYYFGVYVTSVFPMVLVTIVWLIFVLRYSVLVSVGYGEEVTAKLFNEHMHIFLLVVYLFLPPVAGVQFRALNCVVFEDGQSYLAADTSVDCKSDGYQQFVLFDAILIAVYQSLPLFYIALLCQVRDRLNPPHSTSSPELVLKRRDHDKTLDYVRFLFQDYKCSRWYFEVADLYRRMLFTGVLPLFSRDNAIVAYAGCVLALISTIYFRELEPFRVSFTNLLSVIAQYLILLIFLAALMIETDSLDILRLSDLGLGLLLLLLNLFIVGIAIWGGYQRYVDEGHAVHRVPGQTVKIEWAAHFGNNKFATTFRFVTERNVPHSHVLVYYYTSLAEAKAVVIHGGIPATALMEGLETDKENDEYLFKYRRAFGDRGGVVVSLKGPHEIAEGDPSLKLMNLLAPCREAVLCLVLPHALLYKLKAQSSSNSNTSTERNSSNNNIHSLGSMSTSRNCEHFRLLPVEVLETMAKLYSRSVGGVEARGSMMRKSQLSESNKLKPVEPMEAKHATEASNKRHKLSKFLSLPSKCVIRAYQLKDDSLCVERRLHSAEMIHLSSSAAVTNIDEELGNMPAKNHKIVGSSSKSDNDILIDDDDGSISSAGMRKSVLGTKLDQNIARGSSLVASIANNVVSKPLSVFKPSRIKEYVEHMSEVRKSCLLNGWVPLYHYTEVNHLDSIIANGLKMSTQGQGDGGVYFSAKGPCSYGLGTNFYTLNMIPDVFGAEDANQMMEKKKFSSIIVYGADPCCIERIPGGKDSDRMVGRLRFEDIVLPAKDGHYYLRPDRIKAVVSLESILKKQEELKKSNSQLGGFKPMRVSISSKVANQEDHQCMVEESNRDDGMIQLLCEAEASNLQNSASVGDREGFITHMSVTSPSSVKSQKFDMLESGTLDNATPIKFNVESDQKSPVSKDILALPPVTPSVVDLGNDGEASPQASFTSMESNGGGGGGGGVKSSSNSSGVKSTTSRSVKKNKIKPPPPPKRTGLKEGSVFVAEAERHVPSSMRSQQSVDRPID